MDLRTGRTYSSREEALADNVPESDIALIEFKKELDQIIPKVKFAKNKPFASFKNIPVESEGK